MIACQGLIALVKVGAHQARTQNIEDDQRQAYIRTQCNHQEYIFNNRLLETTIQ